MTDQEGVSEAAVAGAPDAVRGEIPVAYVVCDATCQHPGFGSPLPRRDGFLQDPSRVHPGRVAAPDRPRQSTKASTAARARDHRMRVAELPTPALLLDLDLFESNIQRMAQHAAQAGKKLRPHAKAHKCHAIAKRQMEAGAIGVCVATVAEAELMARSGIANILLTSPVADPLKCARMAALCERIEQVGVVVDHLEQVRMYQKQQIDSASK